jgi:hypothetical protein
MYEEELPWVWSGWADVIIAYIMIQVKNRVNLLLWLFMYQIVVASLWPLAALEGDETHNIYMNLISYEYEVCGVPKS